MNEKPSALESILNASFLLLILSLGFMQPSLRFSGTSLEITDAIFVVSVSIFAIGLITGRFRIRYDRFYPLFAFYFLALLLSAIFSLDQRTSFVKLAGEAYLIGLAALTFNTVRSVALARKVIYIWLAAATLTSLIGAVTIALFYINRSNVVHDLFLHRYGSLTPGNYPRLQSTFMYPSILCNFMTVSFVMLLALIRLKWITSKSFVALLVLFTISTAFTVTPGLGGVFLAIGIWIWSAGRNDRPNIVGRSALVSGVTASAAFLLVSAFTLRTIPSSQFRFEILGVTVDPAVRLLTWISSFETFLSYPIFGKGLGLGVADVEFGVPGGGVLRLADAHNIWLNVAGQAGVIGLIAIVVITVAVLRRTFPFRFDGSQTTVLRVCFGIAFLAAFFYQGMVGSFENARHLWVLIGLIMAVDAIANGSVEL
jgi:O-antigen ligase